MQKLSFNLSLKAVNNVLLILIVIICGYIAIAPFWPMISYDLSNHAAEQAKLDKLIYPSRSKSSSRQASSVEPNHIVVPSIGLDAAIYDGPKVDQYNILNKGIWRYSYGSTPALGGNTVLIGHRFTYTDPRGVFYFLNLVKVGDKIAVWWSNKEYLYKVASVSIVSPKNTSIENASTTPKLTLFTCTTLLDPVNRLVVVAYPEGSAQ